MAKVMISLPDDLLGRIDATVRERRTTRSGLLRELAERELEADTESLQERVDALLSDAGDHGGTATAAVRELRRSA